MSSSRYTDSLLRVVILSVSWPIFNRLDEASYAGKQSHLQVIFFFFFFNSAKQKEESMMLIQLVVTTVRREAR